MKTPGFWRLTAGFGVWDSSLIWFYAINGVGCAMGWDAQRSALTLALVAHLCILGWLAARMHGDDLLGSVGVWCARAAFAAIALTFAPALALSVCR